MNAYRSAIGVMEKSIAKIILMKRVAVSFHFVFSVSYQLFQFYFSLVCMTNHFPSFSQPNMLRELDDEVLLFVYSFSPRFSAEDVSNLRCSIDFQHVPRAEREKLQLPVSASLLLVVS